MVSSAAIKGPCKSSRGWSPGTLHIVCPVVLSSFFFFPPSSCDLSGSSVTSAHVWSTLPVDLLLLSPMVWWRIFAFCYWIYTLSLTQLWKLLSLGFIWDFWGSKNPTTTNQWPVQSALLPLLPYWGRKGISPNRNHPAPSTCPGKYYPNTFSVMIPEQQSIFNSSSLKLFSGLWGEFLKKQFVGNVLEN